MTPKQHANAVLKFARKVSMDFIKGFPDDKATWQAAPVDNHFAWVLGHLAMTDVWYASVVGAKTDPAPEGWDKLFGSGSKPVNDPKQYPPIAEIKKAFDANRAAILNWFEGAGEQELAIPLAEKTGKFMTDPIDGFFKLAWHEGWHFGQVATLRRGLGLPSVLG